MRVRVLQKPYYYDRRMWAVGEELDMDDREDSSAEFLAKLGQLVIVTPTSRSGVGYKTAAIKAQQPQPVGMPRHPVAQDGEEKESTAVGPVTAEDDPLAPKKYYRRRDMRAEK